MTATVLKPMDWKAMGMTWLSQLIQDLNSIPHLTPDDLKLIDERWGDIRFRLEAWAAESAVVLKEMARTQVHTPQPPAAPAATNGAIPPAPIRTRKKPGPKPKAPQAPKAEPEQTPIPQ